LVVTWWTVHETVELAEVLLHHWIWLVHGLIGMNISLMLSHVIGPRIHHAIVWHLVWVADLIWQHLSIVEVNLNRWEIVEWIHEIVALIRHKSLICIGKVCGMAQV
jgi:hypothetical protein